MSIHSEVELSQVARQTILSSELNDILVNMDDSFDQILSRVEESLLLHADNCSSDKERVMIRDAHSCLRKKRAEVKKRFKNTFHEMVQQAVNEPKTANLSLDGVDWAKLTLVEGSDVDEDILVSRLATKIRNSAEWELQDLNTRISYLMGKDEPDEKVNPLRPELFCRAVNQACGELDADHQIRMEVMRVFESALSERLSDVYHQLNARLIQRNVLPKIKLRTPPRPSNLPPRRSLSGTNDQTGPGATTAPAGMPGDSHAAHPERQEALQSMIENTLSMFEVLQNLVASNSTYQEVITENPAVAQSRRSLYNAIQELRQAQSFNLEPIALSDLPQLPENYPTDASALTGPSPIPNFIWTNREQLQAAAPNHVDRITIDIVAMLFDQILADEKLPNDIKLLIGRLQMPVLRVALSDPAFFASRGHPARRLIDRISSCSIGYERNGSSDERFFKMVEELVLEVLRSTEDDSGLYEKLLEQFEAYLEQEKSHQDNDIVGKAADLLERAEVREVIGLNATIQINKLLFGLDIDQFIRNFLLDVWSQVIAEAACDSADPENDPQVEGLKRVVLDLVWSTQPKRSAEHRKELVSLLPKLIGAIRQGFQLIAYPPEKETRFFSTLMQLHSTAVRTTGAEELPRVDIEDFTRRLKDLVFKQDVIVSAYVDRQLKVSTTQAERVIAEQQLPVEVVKPEQIRGDVTLNIEDNQLEQWIASLERGNWLMMKTDGEFSKVRLAWISPMRSFYLFSSHQSQRGHSFNNETIRQMFRSGDLRFIEDELLIDRSVRSVMTSLEQNKGKAIPMQHGQGQTAKAA